MCALIVPLPGAEPVAERLTDVLRGTLGRLEVRSFPDGETYLRYATDPRDREVVLVADLQRPDAKALPLLFAADAAAELGARWVGLVAPYLPYMRQDERFKEGEALTSASFARLVSQRFDWLVTVDPHLHRVRSLSGLYGIPSSVAHAAPAIAAWVREHVKAPLLVGPDEESRQWVATVASHLGAPYVVLQKVRRGDHDVDVSLIDPEGWQGRTPVLVDDIVSTARTLVAATRRIREAGLPAPVCVGVHALFAGDAYERLLAAGPARVVTCGTMPHPTNAIDVTGPIAAAVRSCVDGVSARPQARRTPLQT
jgi:ribose-phosphate pyrophosphokinase